jgi:DNA-binding transcriptional LysR family regulator
VVDELLTYMCKDEVDAGLLVRVLPQWSRGTREIHAVFACHCLISPEVRAFIDFSPSTSTSNDIQSPRLAADCRAV